MLVYYQSAPVECRVGELGVFAEWGPLWLWIGPQDRLEPATPQQAVDVLEIGRAHV